MEASAAVELHIVLDHPEDEQRLLQWWDQLTSLLGARYHLVEGRLFVARRSELHGLLEFPVPGAWTLLAQDRRWAELQAKRPPSRMEVVQLRRVVREGTVRTVTTRELEEWLHDRDEGQREFVLANVLDEDDFAHSHIRGSVSLPAGGLDEQRARAVLGDAPGRPVVVYCSGYG